MTPLELENVLEEINAVCEECREPNWDGYDAFGISSETKEVAYQFARCIPENVPAPEIAPDPDGEISFDWFKNVTQRLTIGVGERRTATWATLPPDYGYFPFPYPVTEESKKSLSELLGRFF